MNIETGVEQSNQYKNMGLAKPMQLSSPGHRWFPDSIKPVVVKGVDVNHLKSQAEDAVREIESITLSVWGLYIHVSL